MVEARDVMPLEGYEPEIGLLLATLEDGTREWRGELGDLDPEETARRPFEGGPSVGAELLHIAFVEASWIDGAIAGRPPTEEFRARTLADRTDVDAGVWPDAPAMPLDAYFEIMDEVRYRTREALRDELPHRLVGRNPDRPGATVRWILGHVVQHDSYHGGRATLVKRVVTGGMW